MNFELSTTDASAVTLQKCDALLVLINSTFKASSGALSTLVAKAQKAGDLSEKPGSLLDIYRPVGLECKRLVLVQLGQAQPNDVRKAVSNAIGLIKVSQPKDLVVFFEQTPESGALRATMLTLADASYSYITTKTKPEARSIRHVNLAMPNSAALASPFKRFVATVLGIELAKEWGNRPANHASPSLFAQAACKLAKFARIKCQVLDAKALHKLGMGAFLAVAQGSAEPLQFIVLRYNGSTKTQPPVVLVGKGITFDSGGISLKPAAEMDEMKFDMCGAASVLGVFRALAELQPAINVVGLIPACENLPGSRAVKPGDVVTSMSGQTIEILNTDAEGRLVLCDALTYAERFKPCAVVDIATLTGACVIALGAVRSGLFCNDPHLSAALQAAGDSSQDPCWLMPLDDDYAEGLKTNFADVANVAGRPAGAISAAKFLQRFASTYAWAHLDIAGTAWKSGTAKGATGRPVGLLLDYLLDATKPAKVL
jgi:leucyl aminopeptidase